jgi:hypothetical protein
MGVYEALYVLYKAEHGTDSETSIIDCLENFLPTKANGLGKSYFLFSILADSKL